MSERIFKRGDIYWIDIAEEEKRGSEIRKSRPGVIISNNKQNQFSGAVIVALITSQVDKIYFFEVEVELEGKTGKVLTDQIHTIDKSRCIKKIGQLNEKQLEKLYKGIHTIFELNKCISSW